MSAKKKRNLIIIIIVLAVVVIGIGIYCVKHRTLANVIGWRLMNPDQIIITNGSNGEQYGVEDEDELLQIFRESVIIKSERLPRSMGFARCITLTRNGWDDYIQISPWDKDSFKINNRAYYIDSEQAKKIRKLIKFPEELLN